jgi:SAM-dependent methyltransferase
VSRSLDWDHNAYYHRLVLRHLPRPCRRVLDVGCGAGSLAVELAGRAERVDALDRSPAMIEEARRVAPPNVTCMVADLLQQPLPDAGYDAIVSISALHHMPLPEVLPRLAGALRPGGVLAVAALPRHDLPRELPVELTAGIGHRLFGTAFAILRALDRGRWYAKEPHHAMPVVLDPSLTTRQVRQQASALLPGAQVRRLVFWRYFLLWQKPLETRADPNI